MPPAILWLRQDLRTTDHPALVAAIAEGPVIPLYILDDESPGTRAIGGAQRWRSEEHTSELQSLMRISYAVFCLKKKKNSTRYIVISSTHNKKRQLNRKTYMHTNTRRTN